MFSILMIAGLGVVQETAAVNLSQPSQLLNGQSVIKVGDYPRVSLRRNEYGIVTTLLQVSAEGKVIACDVTESSGSTTLDATTCALFKKRARFEPAKDAAGSPVEGEYRSVNSWGVDEHQPRTNIDMPLQVSAVPSDYRSPVKARLLFDATGHLAACEITTSSGSIAADRAVCAYMKQQLVIAAPKSMPSDNPPVAVRYLTASLSTQAVEPAAKR